MTTLSVQELLARGDLRQAVDALERKTTLTSSERVLRASLEFHLGDPEKAITLADRLLSDKSTDSIVRAQSLAIKGRSLGRLGASGQAMALFRKAITEASSINPSLEAELRGEFVHDLLSWVGIEPALAELPTLRECALKSGNAVALAKFHLANARVEALRNPSSSVTSDLERAEQLLTQSPNPEVRWFVQHVRTGVASMDGYASDAVEYAQHCLSQARASGAKSRIGYALGNLAYTLVNIGEFSDAQVALNECLSSMPNSSLARFAAFHTGIYLALLTGNDSLAAQMIADGDKTARLADSEQSYYRLWFELHRLKWLLKNRRFPEVVEGALEAKTLAARLADQELNDRLILLAAEACCHDGQDAQAERFFEEGCNKGLRVTLPYLVEIFRVAGAIAAPADRNSSLRFLGTARRLLKSAGLAGLAIEVESTAGQFGFDLEDSSRIETHAATLESVGVLLSVGRHPFVLGHELCNLLVRTSTCEWSRLVEEEESGERRTIVNLQSRAGAEPIGGPFRRVFLGPLERGRLWLEAPFPGVPGQILLKTIGRIVEGAKALQEQTQAASEAVTPWFATTTTIESGMVTAADKSRELLRTTRKLAASQITVLITGETGTGKELFARALHDSSPRSAKPFIPFNCSAVSREMLDAQLFGYRKGAFTGAADAFPGVIRAAAGGTLFLDEIGEVALDVQPKLLRFLESGEIHPLGEPRPIAVDVRVVAATNADLEHLVDDGRFREDLFYRLNVVRLHVPPLRERREEIPPLVQHYLEKCSRESQKTGIRVADETMEYLILYKWPGNVRQLANEVRRMVALAEAGAVLMPEHLSQEIAASRRTIAATDRYIAPTEFVVRMDQPMSAAMEHLERSMIQYALRLSGGRVEDAAERLGLSRKGLYLKRQRLAMQDAAAEQQSVLPA